MSAIPPSIGEFGQRFSGRYFGKYRGIVTKVDDDPVKLCRIMARVPVVLGQDEDVGWAWPAHGGGGHDSGDFWAPKINDVVWIEFEEGDPQRPIWSHGPWAVRDSTSMVPLHAQGQQDTVDSQVRGDGIITDSQFAGEYPHVRIRKSRSGHFLEFDDTESEERVQLAHRTGTRIEMLKNGALEVVSTDESRHRTKNSFFLETENWMIELDDSESPFLKIRHKENGDGIEYDGTTRSMNIVATASLSIRSVGQIEIDGLGCTILGRPVIPGSGPIR